MMTTKQLKDLTANQGTKAQFDYVIARSIPQTSISLGVLALDENNVVRVHEIDLDTVTSGQNASRFKKAYSEGSVVLMFSENAKPTAMDDDYPWMVNIAGIQHKKLGTKVEGFELDLRVESEHGEVSETKLVDGYLIDNIYSLQLSGLLGEFSKLLDPLCGKEGFFVELVAVTTRRPGFHDNAVSKLLQLSYSSVSQIRKGDADAVVIKNYDKESTVKSLHSTKMAATLNIDYSDFIKKSGTDNVFVTAKMSPRFRLANSSGYDLPLFDGYKFKSKSTKEFKFETLDKDGNIVVETVIGKVMNFENGKKHLILPKDFTVTKEHDVHISVFAAENNGMTMENRAVMIDAPKTDGMVYIDPSLSKRIAKLMGDGRKFYSSVQFRFTPYVKGLMMTVPDLIKSLGFEMVIFDGAFKADIDRFYENNEFDFSVLNVNRRAMVNPIGRISNQAVGNIINTMSKGSNLRGENEKIWKDIFSLDRDAVFAEFKGQVEEDSEDDESAMPVDTDDLTRLLVSTNVDAALKSAALRNKIKSFMRGKFEKYERGQFFNVNNAQIGYLSADPLAVVDYMKEGYIGIVSRPEMDKGIAPENCVVPIAVLKENEENVKSKVLVPHNGAVGTVRYPMLHVEESRKLNATATPEGYLDNSQSYAQRYEKAVKAGFFEGCIVFSLFDMNPEAMSGADYDGDTCLIILSNDFLQSMKQQPLFLDYSIIESANGSELVSGCPFTSEMIDTFPAFYFKENELTFIKENNIKVTPTKVIINSEVYAANKLRCDWVIDKATRYQLIKSLTGNDIGLYTNVSATISEAQQEATRDLAITAIKENKKLAEFLELEALGLDKLKAYMAMAIRWEIDKAKHGGAFLDKMPFVTHLATNNKEFKNPDALFSRLGSLEDEYGVSLFRLFEERALPTI